MGLLDVAWKRRQTSEEKEEQARIDAERKATKNTEEVVGAIGDVKEKRDMMREFDRIDDPTGLADWVATMVRTTGGWGDILTAEAQQQAAWLVALGELYYLEGNLKAFRGIKVDLKYIFALVAPVQPERKRGDVYLLPYVQKPGNNMPGQTFTPQS